jgi:hypothetical protein
MDTDKNYFLSVVTSQPQHYNPRSKGNGADSRRLLRRAEMMAKFGMFHEGVAGVWDVQPVAN